MCVIRKYVHTGDLPFILIYCRPSNVQVYNIMQHTSHATRWTVEVCTGIPV